MRAVTIKKIVENEVDSVEFSVLGVVISECCFEELIKDNNYFEKIKEKFDIIETNSVLGHPDCAVIIGKMLDKLDENKSIKILKEEIEIELIEFGIISDKVTMFSNGIIFVNGVALWDMEYNCGIDNDEEIDNK